MIPYIVSLSFSLSLSLSLPLSLSLSPPPPPCEHTATTNSQHPPTQLKSRLEMDIGFTWTTKKLVHWCRDQGHTPFAPRLEPPPFTEDEELPDLMRKVQKQTKRTRPNLPISLDMPSPDLMHPKRESPILPTDYFAVGISQDPFEVGVRRVSTCVRVIESV
jgi:hypothetical protein